MNDNYEAEIGELLAELADVQGALLAALNEKRQLLAAGNVDSLSLMSGREQELAGRLQACHDRRQQLLLRADSDGLPTDSIQSLSDRARQGADVHADRSEEPRALDDDPKLAAVQTINRRDEHTIDGAGVDISDGTFRQIGHGQRPTANGQPEAWGVSATAALYRRTAIGERFFDERFFAYYEDVDLCARLHEEGWSTRVLPVVKATHRGSASASVLGKDALRLRTRNRYWVARRHPGVGSIRALLWEDIKKGPSIARIRGVWEGLRT